MNAAGVLLNTGPLVALLSKDPTPIMSPRSGSLRVPAAFAMLRGRDRRSMLLDEEGPSGWSGRGAEPWSAWRLRNLNVPRRTLAEHRRIAQEIRRPARLAGDACLIRIAEIHHEARILTFDADFDVFLAGLDPEGSSDSTCADPETDFQATRKQLRCVRSNEPRRQS